MENILPDYVFCICFVCLFVLLINKKGKKTKSIKPLDKIKAFDGLMEHLYCELGQAPSAQRCRNPSKQRTWFDPNYRDLKVQIRYSYREYRKSDSAQDRHKYLSLKTQLRNCIKEIMQKFILEQWNKLQQAVTQKNNKLFGPLWQAPPGWKYKTQP